MKKLLALLMLLVVSIFIGCDKDNDESGVLIPPPHEELTQKAFADNETTGNGFSFTANTSWTATVTEATPRSAVKAEPFTRAADNSGNNVVWLRLYLGDRETYSGGAGEITLRIEVDQNYTGQRREATITIRSGGNTFTVTVVQEGTKQDGEQNEPPVKVTEISLSKTQLSLNKGAKATLTATVKPTNATIKSVAWSSSNPKVADVNPLTGEITAVDAGKATVTATSSSNKEVSASCSVTVFGDDPQPVPVRKRISHMTTTSWYSHGDSEPEIDGEDEYSFFYDEDDRLTKIVWDRYNETVDPADPEMPSTPFIRRRGSAVPASTRGNRILERSTVLFTYGGRKVSYEIINEEDGVADPHKNSGSVELDESGHAISGKYIYYDHENVNGTEEWTPYSDTYKLFYDTEGRLVKCVSAEEGEERITWTENNPTEVWWGYINNNPDDGAIIDKASYGTVPNKTNLDLNWSFVLSAAEGWAFATGDGGNNLFSLIGLTGKRSQHMAQEVTQSLLLGTSRNFFKFTYETDADGLLTKITQITRNGHNEFLERYETVITYDK